MESIIESLVMLVQEFTAVGTASPAQFVLLTLGGLLTAFSVAVFGYLVLGAVLAPVGGLPVPGRGTRERGEFRPPGRE